MKNQGNSTEKGNKVKNTINTPGIAEYIIDNMNDVDEIDEEDEEDEGDEGDIIYNNPNLGVISIMFSNESEINGFDLCFIDKEKFIIGEMISIMPICKHTFHEKCFREYSENNSHNCPECFIAI